MKTKTKVYSLGLTESEKNSKMNAYSTDLTESQKTSKWQYDASVTDTNFTQNSEDYEESQVLGGTNEIRTEEIVETKGDLLPQTFILKYPVSDVRRTKPVSCFYRKREIISKECDWNDLYADLVVFLYVEHTSEIRSKLNQGINSGKTLIFVDEEKQRAVDKKRKEQADKRGRKFKSSFIRITSNFYVDGHGSATDIAKKIQFVFELCQVDLNELEIRYRFKKTDKSEQDYIEGKTN